MPYPKSCELEDSSSVEGGSSYTESVDSDSGSGNGDDLGTVESLAKVADHELSIRGLQETRLSWHQIRPCTPVRVWMWRKCQMY